MTDLTTPTMTRRLRLGDLPLTIAPVLRRALAAMAGVSKALMALLAAYGKALELAYSAPYARPPQPVIRDEVLEGRDPNW